MVDRRSARNGYCAANSRNASTALLGAVAWMATDWVIGQPISADTTLATLSRRSVSSLPSFPTASVRSASVVRGHGPRSNASRAHRTARSTSWCDAAAVDAIISSVNGEMTSSRSVVDGATHFPPMNNDE